VLEQASVKVLQKKCKTQVRQDSWVGAFPEFSKMSVKPKSAVSSQESQIFQQKVQNWTKSTFNVGIDEEVISYLHKTSDS
jgi:hypothetical protein